MKENQDNEGQQQQTGLTRSTSCAATGPTGNNTVRIPREYVLEGIKDVLETMYKMLNNAIKKYGDRYNRKNEYEECLRRFDLNDTEATLKEYELIMTKQSKQPSVIRGVIKQIGDDAFRYAIKKHLSEQQEQEKDKKED